MEKLVTSLEMSKKLKEAGFEAETPIMWQAIRRYKTKRVIRYELKVCEIPQSSRFGNIPAYTFQQLWEALPYQLGEREAYKALSADGAIAFADDSTEVSCDDDGIPLLFDKDSLMDNVAEAVLWCIEKGYITLDK